MPDTRGLRDRRSEATLLVVEDGESVRSLSVGALQDLGYRAFEAADGPSPLRILEVRNDVDLLFTDVVLPGGMTGAQLAARATAAQPKAAGVVYEGLRTQCDRAPRPAGFRRAPAHQAVQLRGSS